MMSAFKSWFKWLPLFLLLFSQARAVESNLTFPPAKLPVVVYTKFYLLKLFDINEARETFDTEFYLTLHWNDPRLAFDGGPNAEPIPYLEDAADDKLKTIWWPQLEFANAQTFKIANQMLEIYPDGSVDYYLRIIGSFSSTMNFSDFPFDLQTLNIRIDSFVWDKSTLVFAEVPGQKVFSFLDEKTHNDLEILSIDSRTDVIVPGLSARFNEATDQYSTFIVSIEAKRVYNFLVYQIFIPLIIVLGISYCTFFGFTEPFLDRVMICLSCLLVFLASKFTLNLELPKIGYMTIIDKAFLVSYIAIALTTLETVVQRTLRYKSDELAKKLDYHSRWAMPVLVLLIGLFVYFFS